MYSGFFGIFFLVSFSEILFLKVFHCPILIWLVPNFFLVNNHSVFEHHTRVSINLNLN